MSVLITHGARICMKWRSVTRVWICVVDQVHEMPLPSWDYRGTLKGLSFPTCGHLGEMSRRQTDAWGWADSSVRAASSMSGWRGQL